MLRNILKISIRITGCKNAHHMPSEDRRYRLVTSRITKAHSKVKKRVALFESPVVFMYSPLLIVLIQAVAVPFE